jgi:hypothetical protein
VDASIVAIGLIVLHAFATAVLWFELRSYEKESRERIDRATEAVLNAIGLLRGDLAPLLGGGPGGGGPRPGPSGGAPPAPALPTVERRAVSAPVPADEPAPVTRRSTAPGDARAARTTSSNPPPPVEVENAPTLASATDAPTSASIRAAFHAEADEKDARDAARGAQGALVLPVAPSDDVAVVRRFQGTAPGEDDATIRKAVPPPPPADDDEGWDRDTGEEGTRMWERPPVTRTERPPHAPPRPMGGRPTLLGGLAGAPLVQPRMDHRRTVEDFAKRHGAGMGGAQILPVPVPRRETPTPTEPSTPAIDAEIQRRWAELVAAAQEKGIEVGHCHAGEKCMDRGEGIALCACRCDGCARLLALLVKAEAQIRRERGEG